MLALVDLTLLEARHRVAELVGRHAHLEQHLGLVPRQTLAADDARLGLEGRGDEEADAVPVEGNVVMDEQVVLRPPGIRGDLECPVGRGPETDIAPEVHDGGAGQQPFDQAGHQVPVLGGVVDDDDLQGRIGLARKRFEATGKPATAVVGHDNRQDQGPGDCVRLGHA